MLLSIQSQRSSPTWFAEFHVLQVGNAIGKGNRHWFLVFLWLELYAMLTSAVIAIIQIRHHVVGDNFSAGNLVGAHVLLCHIVLWW